MQPQLEGNYLSRIRSFSSNAKLYIVHVFGMDYIYGTWEVLFNLYLLVIGFNISFIGLRLLIGGITGALAALPSGSISDRIGRKASFILGDGGGAAFSMVEITTINPTILLITPSFKAVFGTLHRVTEPPFMAENSRALERVHLFSVATSIRTIAAMLGAFTVAALPVVNVPLDQKIFYFRAAVAVGVIGWFLSLVPALLLREISPSKEKRPRLRPFSLAKLVSRRTVSRLLVADGLLAIGAGLTLPFLNVYFRVGLSAHEHTIGTTFALGSLSLAVASFLAPLASGSLGKVNAIFATRTLSVPFILTFAYAVTLPDLGTAAFLASFAYIGRTSFMNMSGPISDAFTMELLLPKERATVVGLESSSGQILSGLSSLLGGFLMNSRDFVTPFLAMAAFYLTSNFAYLSFFRNARPVGLEAELQRASLTKAVVDEALVD